MTLPRTPVLVVMSRCGSSWKCFLLTGQLVDESKKLAKFDIIKIIYGVYACIYIKYMYIYLNLKYTNIF
jgi:hypothetical protein